MKRYAPIALLVVICAALSGCQSTGTTTQTPAAIAAQVCPVVNTTIAALQADPALSAVAKADLAKAAPIAVTVCSAASTVTTSNLEALASAAFPLLIQIAGGSSNPALADGLVAAQIVLTAVMAQVESTAAAPAAPK